ncbi:D-aminoacylase [Sandaracinobacter sp. RS1-74]|uniref:N-acyl-D-amino-acid deacylase family protein n=1 Tax=Sandaracinobacteroides sayramensis TaxID=2913411 RepID=UPI001EDB5D9E|nr:D-aminoacylase [Sandaracinobacteroides sayramensis]MCG2840642.1 D-aminoacylase [Sandaracinobacteroides sayramensis]
MSASYFFRAIICLATALALAGCVASPAYDRLIVGGTLYDGTGAPPRAATIAIEGDRIARVVSPQTRLKAPHVIDATGLAVAPGFIDAHSHVPESLDQISGPFLDVQDISQGVTTIVAGPDGAAAPRQLALLRAELERRGTAVNHACYVGHNGIRTEVMPGARRPATDAEVARMAALVREGMAAGCVGLSTGLMYDPGLFATEAEVQALAREVKPFGGSYDSHTRDPGFRMLESESEAVRLGEATGVPVKLAHLKAVGLINKGRIGEVIAMVEAAQARGVAVTADQYPFDGATLRYARELFLKPGGGMPDAGALVDPAQRGGIRLATETGVDGGFSWVKAVGYGSMRIVDAPDAPELVDRNIELLAGEWGVDPFDALVRLTLDHRDVRLTLGSVDEGDIRELIVKPWVMIASDGFYADGKVLAAGKAHPRSWGSFTRVLGHYSRDLALLPLPEAIRKMTSLPADHLGLADRGRIAPGKAADIVIFDPATVGERATYLQPSAQSVGISRVLVNGREVFRDGRPTGDTPGRFVPRQKPPAGERVN